MLRHPGLRASLLALFPSSIEAYACPERFDIAGWDFALLTRQSLMGFELKARSVDPRTFGSDDLAIEIWSNREKGIPGYRSDQTDYIMWFFEPTQRVVILPYLEFKRRYLAYRDIFIRSLPQLEQQTEGLKGECYTSVHCYVPFELFADIAMQFDPTAALRAA